MNEKQADILAEPQGNIVLVSGGTDAGWEWLADNLQDGGLDWCGRYVVEHRYVVPILQGADLAGLLVRAVAA